MEYLHLEVSNSVTDGKSRRVTLLRDDSRSKPIEVFYEFDRIISWSENTVLDGHVFAILLYAMAWGKALKVHGTLSQTALRNLEELQLVWCRWKPDSYKKIEIIPDKIDNSRKTRSEEKAISAFSGGVDATFTALRHTKILPDSVRYPLHSVLMVHGFDVEIYNNTGFDDLTKRVQPTLDDLQLELRTIRTNSRELKIQDWDYSHGLELAACLNMYSDEFAFGLIGSSDPYDDLPLPWGSSPVTDHRMSGNNFSIIHDGSGFSRTEKASAIKDFPLACRTLKVCWAGVDQSGNCGKCEKCVRTRLNFLASGMASELGCFHDKFDVGHVDSMKIIKQGQVRGFKEIIDCARNNKVNGEWLNALETKIAGWIPPDLDLLKRQKTGGFIKRTIVKLISAVGLDVSAKMIWRRLRRVLLK